MQISSRRTKSGRNSLALMTHIVLLSTWLSLTNGFVLPASRPTAVPSLLYSSSRQQQQQESDTDSAARAALERTAAHLQRLQPLQLEPDDPQDPLRLERETLYQEYIQQAANTLKGLLKERRLSDKGRKPDLANRLVAYELQQRYGDTSNILDDKESAYVYDEIKKGDTDDAATKRAAVSDVVMPDTFAGLDLSSAARTALQQAGFCRPTPIQRAVIPSLVKGESLIMHAQTGSGKTIAYLLPMTEYLWKTHRRHAPADNKKQQQQRCVVLLPTRELAAQVAGVAMELAPPGTVRLVTHPSNLLRPTSQQQQDGMEQTSPPRLLISSAKTFMVSLYGNDQMPAPPTSKPEAVDLLRSIRICVLDEVDRLLGVGGSTGTKYKPSNKQHEKPAAIVTAAIARHTLGRAQIVAASATVGRPLKRELSRVLGLLPQDCPRVLRSAEDGEFDDDEEEIIKVQAASPTTTGHVGRAVTMPATVQHYSVVASGSSDGELLTSASKVIRALQQSPKPSRILVVLSKAFGISSTNTIGALKHFQCEPAPVSLLDALEADNTLAMIEKHRAVSQAAGVGQSSSLASSSSEDRYLLVTGEDTVRGLHLDGLDVVIVVGRPKGPDEYCHIAGRTGRAGRSGSVINVVSQENAKALSSWQTMLECKFEALDPRKAQLVLEAK